MDANFISFQNSTIYYEKSGRNMQRIFSTQPPKLGGTPWQEEGSVITLALY